MEILNRNDNSLGVFFTPGTHNTQKDASGIDINYRDDNLNDIDNFMNTISSVTSTPKGIYKTVR